jgi:hypothetical protein
MRTSKVTQSLGFTVNMGNYESARVDVSVEIEATSDEDTVRSMHDEAQQQVRQELWESIQPFVGGWSEQRRAWLAERLGVVLQESDSE